MMLFLYIIKYFIYVSDFLISCIEKEDKIKIYQLKCKNNRHKKNNTNVNYDKILKGNEL